MYSGVLFLLIFCLVNSCVECLESTPCDPDDEPCVSAIVEHYAAPILSKIVKDSFEKCDSIEIDKIIGNFSTLRYVECNNTVTGLSCCNMTKMNISPDMSVAQFVFECPSYVLTGKNKICGYFLYIPIIGNGTHDHHFGKECVTVYAKIKRVNDCDGKSHLQFGDFTVFEKTLGPTKYKLQGHYHGNSYLTNIVNDFLSCHWKEMSYFINGPLWNSIFVKIFTECNMTLLKIAAEKLFMCH